jgi:hypothetical protein
MVGVGQEARGGVDFSTFFHCPQGATPPELISRNIYHEIALPFKGDAWRATSMVLLHSALAKGDAEDGFGEMPPRRVMKAVTAMVRGAQRGLRRLSITPGPTVTSKPSLSSLTELSEVEQWSLKRQWSWFAKAPERGAGKAPDRIAVRRNPIPCAASSVSSVADRRRRWLSGIDGALELADFDPSLYGCTETEGTSVSTTQLIDIEVSAVASLPANAGTQVDAAAISVLPADADAAEHALEARVHRTFEL